MDRNPPGFQLGPDDFGPPDGFSVLPSGGTQLAYIRGLLLLHPHRKNKKIARYFTQIPGGWEREGAKAPSPWRRQETPSPHLLGVALEAPLNYML